MKKRMSVSPARMLDGSRTNHGSEVQLTNVAAASTAMVVKTCHQLRSLFSDAKGRVAISSSFDSFDADIDAAPLYAGARSAGVSTDEPMRSILESRETGKRTAFISNARPGQCQLRTYAFQRLRKDAAIWI